MQSIRRYLMKFDKLSWIYRWIPERINYCLTCCGYPFNMFCWHSLILLKNELLQWPSPWLMMNDKASIIFRGYNNGNNKNCSRILRCEVAAIFPSPARTMPYHAVSAIAPTGNKTQSKQWYVSLKQIVNVRKQQTKRYCESFKNASRVLCRCARLRNDSN